MSGRGPEEVRAWLQTRPSLRELREAYPREWDTVQHDLAQAVGRGDVEDLKAYVLALASRPPAPARGGRSRGAQEAGLAAQIRRQMTVAALREASLSAATGVTSGRLRFNLVNGWVMQRLLFRRGFERKPVSRFWFRLLWPLLWQRRYLMPLVEPKGIYCFYSRGLVRALAARIGDRSCVEIAAGDGTLSRFLADEGVQVTATDDHSWTHAIDFPSTVVRQDARTALRTRRPAVVLCSWPPPGNTFEAEVFRTPSVELYLLIASRHEFAAGNFVAYEQQNEFTFAEARELSRLVLPPELEGAVYVFERSSE